MTEEYAAGRRLLSSVISLAIQDACLAPFKESKKLRLHSEAEDALEFLFYSEQCDKYLMVMDIDPTTFRRCLLSAVRRERMHDITASKLRCFRINYRLFMRSRDGR